MSTVLKMRIKSVSKNGSERIIKGRVHRVLQKGLVDLRKGDTVYLRSNTTCDCPQISRMNADYLVAGHEDVREKRLYLLPATGVVETWERAWVSKFRKWERRFAAKRLLGKKRNRKNRKRQRKGRKCRNSSFLVYQSKFCENLYNVKRPEGTRAEFFVNLICSPVRHTRAVDC